MSSRVLVSSSDMLTYWFHDSLRFAPLASAFATKPWACAASVALTVKVSKAEALVSVQPSCCRPRASTAV